MSVHSAPLFHPFIALAVSIVPANWSKNMSAHLKKKKQTFPFLLCKPQTLMVVLLNKRVSMMISTCDHYNSNLLSYAVLSFLFNFSLFNGFTETRQ